MNPGNSDEKALRGDDVNFNARGQGGEKHLMA